MLRISLLCTPEHAWLFRHLFEILLILYQCTAALRLYTANSWGINPYISWHEFSICGKQLFPLFNAHSLTDFFLTQRRYVCFVPVLASLKCKIRGKLIYHINCVFLRNTLLYPVCNTAPSALVKGFYLQYSSSLTGNHEEAKFSSYLKVIWKKK